MQVLGDLIKLEEDSGKLPLPWWHRAPLGLTTGTWCYLSIVDSPERPVGDLVVSVLDPHKWQDTLAIQARRPDRPGVVSDAINAMNDTNIALAESVTMESGTEHEVTLICETSGKLDDDIVKHRLKEAGFSVDATRSYPEREVLWKRLVEVQNGWLRTDEWKDEIVKRFGSKAQFERIDLQKVVISADTGNRLLRYVFPFKDARTIAVEHLDTPGAMRRVTDVFFRHHLNVLSILLRRGGAKPGNAILIAACEPKDGRRADGVYAEVRQEIEQLPARLMAEPKISAGLDAAKSIVPREKDTVVARVPRSLRARVDDERAELLEGKLPVFFSRRFVDDWRPNALAREVEQALFDTGCQPLEAAAQNEAREQAVIFDEVSAKMWVAKAGIILVNGVSDAEVLGKNLPHEFGFLQGQTKPILLLVENGCEDAVKVWSNVDGVYRPRFPDNEEALNRDSANSVYRLVEIWTKRIRGIDDLE